MSKQREKDEAVSKNAAQLAVDGNVPDAVIDRLLDSDLPRRKKMWRSFRMP